MIIASRNRGSRDRSQAITRLKPIATESKTTSSKTLYQKLYNKLLPHLKQNMQ